jgi:hypothetical protein
MILTENKRRTHEKSNKMKSVWERKKRMENTIDSYE